MANPLSVRSGICAIGNLLVDHTLRISDYPQESMLATISKIERHCGGGCTNLLFNLAKLDPHLPLYLGGNVGKDSDGQFILQQAAQRQINLDGVSEVDLATSFTDVMINSQTGDRTFFHYVGAMESYSLEQILRIDNQAKILHIAYLPLLPSLLELSTLRTLFNGLRQKGFLISIDLVSIQDEKLFKQYILPILPDIDYVIINDVEAKILLDKTQWLSDETHLTLMAQQILQLGVRQSVIVHEPKWAAACNRQGEQVAIPSYWVEKKDIVSTLGAGDAFCAGVLYGLHQQLPLTEILQLGHALAYFNLFSLSATDGAVPFEQIKQFWLENKKLQ